MTTRPAPRPVPRVRPLDEGVLDQVLATLPAPVSRTLDRPDVHLVIAELLDGGWTPPQLAARVSSLRIAGDTARAARDLLLGLLEEDSPRVRADRERAERRHDAAAPVADGPPPRPPGRLGGAIPDGGPDGRRAGAPGGEAGPVSDEARARWITEVRRSLKGAARPRPEPAPRTRPDCAICAQESAYFVTREVHLCSRCVHLLAAGQVRLAPSA